MPLSSSKKLLSVVVEDESGIIPDGTGGFVADALSDPANARSLVIEPSISVELEVEESNAVNDSLTPLRSTIGRKTVTQTFGIEVKGTKLGTFAAGVPDWFKFLNACFFKQVSGDLLAITGNFSTGTVGTTDAPFRHGELILGASSGATARVIHDTHDGATQFILRDTTGTFTSSEVVTGQSTGAVCTVGATTAERHYSLFPVSSILKTVAVDAIVGDDIPKGSLLKGQTSGAGAIVTKAALIGATSITYTPAGGTFDGAEALDLIGPSTPKAAAATTTDDPVFTQGQTVATRMYEDGRTTTAVGMQGDVTIDFEVSKPTKLNFDLRGGFSDTSDRPMIEGIDFDYRVAPAWEDAIVAIGTNEDASTSKVSHEVTACLTTLSIGLGNSVTDRLCASAPGGVAGSSITARAGTISMDPEAQYETEFPWAGNLYAGNVSRFRTAWGKTDGNRFLVSMPGIQANQAGHGDRDGALTIDFAGNLTGGNNWNLNGPDPDISSTGGDNEVVLTYFTAA